MRCTEPHGQTPCLPATDCTHFVAVCSWRKLKRGTNGSLGATLNAGRSFHSSSGACSWFSAATAGSWRISRPWHRATSGYRSWFTAANTAPSRIHASDLPNNLTAVRIVCSAGARAVVRVGTGFIQYSAAVPDGARRPHEVLGTHVQCLSLADFGVEQDEGGAAGVVQAPAPVGPVNRLHHGALREVGAGAGARLARKVAAAPADGAPAVPVRDARLLSQRKRARGVARGVGGQARAAPRVGFAGACTGSKYSTAALLAAAGPPGAGHPRPTLQSWMSLARLNLPFGCADASITMHATATSSSANLRPWVEAAGAMAAVLRHRMPDTRTQWARRAVRPRHVRGSSLLPRTGAAVERVLSSAPHGAVMRHPRSSPSHPTWTRQTQSARPCSANSRAQWAQGDGQGARAGRWPHLQLACGDVRTS